MKGNKKKEVLDRLSKGQTVDHISMVMRIERWQIDEINAHYWINKYKESIKISRILEKKIDTMENMECKNIELKNKIESLENKIKQMIPAIESVNRLTAERSILIRRLKRAGVKI